jgi:hypothetical protein
MALVVSKFGYYIPFGVVGLGIGSIGTGLLTTLLPNSSTGHWAGFELLAGIRGMALQIVRLHNPIFSLARDSAPALISVISQNRTNQIISHSHL